MKLNFNPKDLLDWGYLFLAIAAIVALFVADRGQNIKLVAGIGIIALLTELLFTNAKARKLVGCLLLIAMLAVWMFVIA